MSRLILGFMVCVMWNASASAQACFTPLKDPTSTKPSDWKSLVEFVGDVQQDGVIRPQPIAGGSGDKINLDYYSIIFRKHPTRSISEVFRSIRRNFNNFAHEGEVVYEEPTQFSVIPYRGSPSPDDALAVRNNTLWGSENPKGAVMSFILSSYTPALARVTATFQGVKFVVKKGDVVATCSSATDLVFSTVRTEKDDYHPVNGNRGFGIKDNSDGTWTFYTMGADRECKNDLGVLCFGNVVLHGKGPDAVFQAGHEFWLHFFADLMGYLERTGMPVKYDTFITNSHRYPYQP